MSADTHVDPVDLAQCAEGTLPEELARPVRDHLAECRSCMAAYVDAVRYRAAWLADAQSFRLEGADRALLPGSVPDQGIRVAGSGWPPVLTRVALATSVVLIASIGIQVMNRPATPTLGFRLDPATLEATALSASTGLVLPGTESHAADEPLDRRSGSGSSSLELEAELKGATEAYETGSRDPATSARVVAALLASGDVATAHVYGQEALRAHPNSVPLLVFVAAVKTRMNQLSEAEQLLRHAIRQAPRDPIVALDLGMVLCRLGRGDESRRWLERTAASNVVAVAARARRELAHCSAGAAPR